MHIDDAQRYRSDAETSCPIDLPGRAGREAMPASCHPQRIELFVLRYQGLRTAASSDTKRRAAACRPLRSSCNTLRQH